MLCDHAPLAAGNAGMAVQYMQHGGHLMLRFRDITLAAALSIFATSVSAVAALVDRDLFLTGDALLTYDTVNHRDWLKITATYGLSVEEVRDQLSDTGQYKGFTIASYDDVLSLLTSAGFDPNFIPGDQDYDLAASFIDVVYGAHLTGGIIGDLRYTSGRYRGVNGTVGDESINVYTIGTKPPPGSVPLQYAYSAGINNSFNFPPLGFWIFRESIVPEPSAKIQVSIVGVVLVLCSRNRRV